MPAPGRAIPPGAYRDKPRVSHAYNGHYSLYELPAAHLPQKQCSRWNRLIDRVTARANKHGDTKLSAGKERGVV